MKPEFVVQDARCYLGVRQGEFPSVEIHIAGIASKLGRLPDAVKMCDFEKSVEKYVSQELPKFVIFEGVEP